MCGTEHLNMAAAVLLLSVMHKYLWVKFMRCHAKYSFVGFKKSGEQLSSVLSFHGPAGLHPFLVLCCPLVLDIVTSPKYSPIWRTLPFSSETLAGNSFSHKMPLLKYLLGLALALNSQERVANKDAHDKVVQTKRGRMQPDNYTLGLVTNASAQNHQFIFRCAVSHSLTCAQQRVSLTHTEPSIYLSPLLFLSSLTYIF